MTAHHSTSQHAKPHQAKPNTRPSNFEDTHIVVAGESLSKIAAHYRSHGRVDLTDWHPIFVLTAERTGLWRDKQKSKQLNNENLIYPGDLLVIPRSRAGYQAVIQGIKGLMNDTVKAPSYAEQVKKDAEHFSHGLDLTSDALQFVATMGGSALKSARAAKFAKGVLGKAALEFLKESKEKALDMGLKLVEYVAEATDHEKVAKVAGVATKVKDYGGIALNFQKEAREKILKKELRELARATGDSIVEVVDKVFELSDASTWSKGFVYLLTGAGVDSTIDGAIEQEKQAKEHLIRLLDDKIHSLQREYHLVYAN